MNYETIRPMLSAYRIVVKDRQHKEVPEQEAKHRLVKEIRAGKVRPDEIYVVVY